MDPDRGGRTAAAGGVSRSGAVSTPATKAARQAKITGILASTPVRSQDELVDLLAADGIVVTQATLSRDLDELGAVRLRGADGALVYALPPDYPDTLSTGTLSTGTGAPPPPADPQGTGPLISLPASVLATLGKVAADLLLSAEASGNLVVLRTPPGAAQLMASMIDRAGASAVLGTVAGDDTVLVVARDPLGGNDLAAALLRLAERRTQPRRGK